MTKRPDKPLLLVAASGLAREVVAMVRAHAICDVAGFLDDSPALAGATVDGARVLGPIDAVMAYPDAQILVCAGRGQVREKIVARLSGLGVPATQYATVVHPAVEIPESCEVGVGSIILGGVVLTTAVAVGKHVVVMPNATLTHDCVLHDYATVCAGVALGGNVVVEAGAYLGMNASVRERVIVGANATLGMGSVLLNSLPSGETWAGVPAQRISSFTDRDGATKKSRSGAV